MLAHRPGDAVERAAFVVLVDSVAGKTYEAVVSLSQGRVLSWEHVPGAQPAIVLDEFVECEEAVRADPRWQEAMRQRGITDFDLAMVDPWSAGNFGFPEDEGARLVRALRGCAGTRGQRLRPPGRQPAHRRRPEHDGGGPRRGRRRGAAAAGGRATTRRRRRAAHRPQAARDQPAGRAELRARGPRAALAELAVADRLHAPRGPGAAHAQLRRPGPRAAGPVPRLDRRDGGALRRPAPDLLPPQRLRRRRVRHRHAGQRAEIGCDCLGEIRYLDALVNDGQGRRSR